MTEYGRHDFSEDTHFVRSVVAPDAGYINAPVRDRFTGREAAEATTAGRAPAPERRSPEARLAEAGGIISRQAVDLGRREPFGDRPHAGVDVVAALAGGIGLQLHDHVVISLLVQDRRLDRTAGARTVARRARRDVAVGIAELDELHDVRRQFAQRRGIGIALGLAGVIGG